MYDDAIQSPLFERAGIEKVKYFNELHYLYTNNYASGGDGNSVYKLLYRVGLRISFMFRRPLEKIESLD